MANIIQFPKLTKAVKKREARTALDDIFLEQLHSLPPQDQEKWRENMRYVAQMAARGEPCGITVFRRSIYE